MPNAVAVDAIRLRQGEPGNGFAGLVQDLRSDIPSATCLDVVASARPEIRK